MACASSASRLSPGPRVSLGGCSLDCGGLSPHMGWSRQSGSPAVLPRTHPAPAAALSQSVSYSVTPSASYGSQENGCGDEAFTLNATSAERAAALAACASPRALGDVPLLLCEQQRLAPPQPPAQVPMRANSASERRTRNASAGLVALGGDVAASGLVEKKGQLPRNYSSFGADSKWGFDDAHQRGSQSVFRMELDVDMDMDYD